MDYLFGDTKLLNNMTKKGLALALGLFLAMPMFLTADDGEVEIQLIEVIGVGVLPADAPLDDPGHAGANPTDPNQFRATITGRTLAVTVDNANNTQVIVRNASGTVVLNSQFYGFTAEQLAATGAHTIEIRNGGLTLVGSFTAR